ncbi:MAG: glycosyl transferase [Caulobacteraceae bacterium]|nr:glycosyl transferase [Caulobacter sp.]
MASTQIVTGGDAGYFPLIDELCASVRAARDADAVGLVVIDGGLRPEQQASLSARWGARMLQVGWDYDIPARRVRGREHLKVLTSRTFLDQRLPEADTIVWIDGDAWVQDMAAVDLLVRGAALGRIAVVSQTSRYARLAMSLKWGPFGWAQVRSQLYKNARRAGLGEALARRVGDKPTFNAGVFALRRDAPHWAAWRARLGECLRRGRVFTSDQLALGIMVHADGLPAELMPETCNYMGPLWTCDADARVLVERYLPNAPVGVVHMAGYDEMRRGLEITTPIRTLDGRELARSLRYPAWSGATA